MNNNDYFYELEARIHGIEHRLATLSLSDLDEARLRYERDDLIAEYNAGYADDDGIGSGY